MYSTVVCPAMRHCDSCLDIFCPFIFLRIRICKRAHNHIIFIFKAGNLTGPKRILNKYWSRLKVSSTEQVGGNISICKLVQIQSLFIKVSKTKCSERSLPQYYPLWKSLELVYSTARKYLCWLYCVLSATAAESLVFDLFCPRYPW